jgi:hypothetical protein
MRTYLQGALCFLLLTACNTPRNGSTDLSPAILIDSLSSCAYLTNDTKNNVVLSYIRDLNDSISVMRYRISLNHGETFGEPVEIAPSTNIHPHGENLPKIAFKPSGEIIAVWGSDNANPKNKYSGLIYYSQSFDQGRTWNGAIPLVTDTSSYDQRYFDIALLPDGEVGIIWLDNREKINKEGSTLFYAATKGRGGFQNETVVEASICPCCRTELFVDKRKRLHASFRDIINDSIRDMVHVVSTDNGRSFSKGRRISPDNWVINGCPHTGPAMTENEYGLHFAWYTGEEPAGVFYCNSQDGGITFSAKDSVSRLASAKHPQIASFPTGALGIVWDESVKRGQTYNTRIGFQPRDREGKAEDRLYITPDSLICEFPAIFPLAPDKAIVTFTEKRNGCKSVKYKLLEF